MQDVEVEVVDKKRKVKFCTRKKMCMYSTRSFWVKEKRLQCEYIIRRDNIVTVAALRERWSFARRLRFTTFLCKKIHTSSQISRALMFCPIMYEQSYLRSRDVAWECLI